MGPSPGVPVAALRRWRGLELRGRLSGGHRTEVFRADLADRRVVVRVSSRAQAALDWELDLLEHVAAAGVHVPTTVPADDGCRQVDGVTVQEFVPGEPPSSPRDWKRVAEAIRAVHECTVGWSQRPGFASSRHLLSHDRGGDVALDAMPADLVARIRAAWSAVQHGESTVVHGDPGRANLRIHDGRVVILDWDEARVDVPWFDLASLLSTGPLPAGLEPHAVAVAGIAWEVAACWGAEPDYARSRAAALGWGTREQSDG